MGSFLRVSLAVLLGIPIPIFIALLLALNVLSVFNHANLRLPEVLDRGLRLLIFTPNMQQTHDSVHLDDDDTNFAFIFSFWDRLFRIYKVRTTPLEGRVVLGVDELGGKAETGAVRLLSMPFRNSAQQPE